MNNYKFSILLYDSRSGSTLLSSILNQYKGIKSGLESAYPRLLLEYPNKTIGSNEEIDKLLDVLYSEIQFQEMKIERGRIEELLKKSEKPFPLKNVFFAIVEIFFNKTEDDNSEQNIVLKIPFIYHYLNTLNSLIPNYKIIHLVRDGRAVFSSKRNSKGLSGDYFERNLLVAAIGWKRKLKIALNSSQDIIHIKYENLVSDTDYVMSTILDFLNIESDGRTIVKNIQDYANAIGEKQKNFHTNVGKNPQKSNIDKWLTDLTETEIFLYEWITYKELKRFKYPIYKYNNKNIVMFMKASSLTAYLMFYYVSDRSKKIFRSYQKGDFTMLFKRKLIQLGIINPKNAL